MHPESKSSSSKRQAGKAKWQVRLGEPEWQRFTYARTEEDNLRLLGSVRRGAQVGALAITDDGKYVQVVGDYIQPLNTGQLTRAVALAVCSQNRQPAIPAFASPPSPSAPPVIVRKRRRVVVTP